MQAYSEQFAQLLGAFSSGNASFNRPPATPCKTSMFIGHFIDDEKFSTDD
jgi:hypothetical protein